MENKEEIYNNSEVIINNKKLPCSFPDIYSIDVSKYITESDIGEDGMPRVTISGLTNKSGNNSHRITTGNMLRTILRAYPAYEAGTYNKAELNELLLNTKNYIQQGARKAANSFSNDEVSKLNNIIQKNQERQQHAVEEQQSKTFEKDDRLARLKALQEQQVLSEPSKPTVDTKPRGHTEPKVVYDIKDPEPKSDFSGLAKDLSSKKQEAPKPKPTKKSKILTNNIMRMQPKMPKITLEQPESPKQVEETNMIDDILAEDNDIPINVVEEPVLITETDGISKEDELTEILSDPSEQIADSKPRGYSEPTVEIQDEVTNKPEIYSKFVNFPELPEDEIELPIIDDNINIGSIDDVDLTEEDIVPTIDDVDDYTSDEVQTLVKSNDYVEMNINDALGILSKIKSKSQTFLEKQEEILAEPIMLPRTGIMVKIKPVTQAVLTNLQINLLGKLDDMNIYKTNEIISLIMSEDNFINRSAFSFNTIDQLVSTYKNKIIYSRDFVETVIYNNITFEYINKTYMTFDSFYTLLDPFDCLALANLFGLMIKSDFEYTMGCINPECDNRYYDYVGADKTSGEVILEHKMNDKGEYVKHTDLAKKVNLKETEIIKSDIYNKHCKYTEGLLISDGLREYSVRKIMQYRFGNNKFKEKHDNKEVTVYKNKTDLLTINAQFVSVRVTLEQVYATYDFLMSKRQLEAATVLKDAVEQINNNVSEEVEDEYAKIGGVPSDKYNKLVEELYTDVSSKVYQTESRYFKTIFAENKELYETLIFCFTDGKRKTKSTLTPSDAFDKLKEYLSRIEYNRFISSVIISSMYYIIQYLENTKYKATTLSLGFDRSQWICPECGEELGISSNYMNPDVNDEKNTLSEEDYQSLNLGKFQAGNFLKNVNITNLRFTD